MRLILSPSEDLDNWWLIVRAEHDGRDWVEERDRGRSFYYMRSDRPSPEADVEGTAGEMVAIAFAIRKRRDESFKRVGVKFCKDGVHIYSPKNSQHDAIITLEEADALANDILLKLKHLSIV